MKFTLLHKHCTQVLNCVCMCICLYAYMHDKNDSSFMHVIYCCNILLYSLQEIKEALNLVHLVSSYTIAIIQ